MSILADMLVANERYASAFAKGDLPIQPARHLAVLTCMDSRIDAMAAFGLHEGDAHIIRNAGGRASDDAIRSLAISQQLAGTREVVVIHHTDCALNRYNNDEIRARLHDRLGADPASVDFLPFADLDASVREDVAKIRSSRLILPETLVSGLVYDVRTGRLRLVA